MLGTSGLVVQWGEYFTRISGSLAGRDSEGYTQLGDYPSDIMSSVDSIRFNNHDTA